MSDRHSGPPSRGGHSPQSGWTEPPLPIPPYPNSPSKPPAAPGPWGFWATMGWMLLMIGALIMAGLVAVAPFWLWVQTFYPSHQQAMVFKAMAENGDYVWINCVVGAPMAGSILILALMIKHDYPARLYLAIRNTSLRAWIAGLIAIVVFSLGADQVLSLFGLDPESDWMVAVYNSAQCFPCLMIAVVLLAPFIEELIFRGFMFAGVEARLGGFWAVILSSAPWALTHIQYSWYHMLTIFFLGVVLGTARLRSRSLLLPIAMHMLQNLMASLQLWLM